MRQPQSAPDYWKYISEAGTEPYDFFRKSELAEVKEFVRKANDGYLHWDKVRRYPMPAGIHPIEMWGTIALSRSSQFRKVELSRHPEVLFRYWTPPQQQEWLHRIDQDAGGFIGSRSKTVPRDGEDRFLYNSLMEEAIASSQLEGASTTRAVAKRLLRSGRRPRDKHEQMILNNYNAILELRDCKDVELTPELLCHIQEVITHKTLSNADAAGRFRNEQDDAVCVVDARTDEVIYSPPSVSSIDWRIKELCDFANERSKPFIHPVIKAIILHFMLGFIHPFVDGNGRTARAIFYWFMLKSGYWIFEFLPISRIVLDAPAKYVRAYLYSENDNGDLTYFIQYHLRLIERAVREMIEYFERQQAFLHHASQMIQGFDLNHRQLSAANYAIQHPHSYLTFKEHSVVHNVALATARSDLNGLEEAGVLVKKKYGKSWAFVPAEGFRGGVAAFRSVRKKAARAEVAITKQVDPPAQQPMPPESKKTDPQFPLLFPDLDAADPNN